MHKLTFIYSFLLLGCIVITPSCKHTQTKPTSFTKESHWIETNVKLISDAELVSFTTIHESNVLAKDVNRVQVELFFLPVSDLSDLETDDIAGKVYRYLINYLHTDDRINQIDINFIAPKIDQTDGKPLFERKRIKLSTLTSLKSNITSSVFEALKGRNYYSIKLYEIIKALKVAT